MSNTHETYKPGDVRIDSLGTIRVYTGDGYISSETQIFHNKENAYSDYWRQGEDELVITLSQLAELVHSVKGII